MRFRHTSIFDIDQLMDMCAVVSSTVKTLNKMRENMNHRRRMERLQQEIRDEQQAMDNCSYGDWTEPIYDPETNRVPSGFKTVGQGSDVWMEADGYKDETKNRWSRECKKCGKIQYTYTQEPVVTGYKPSFK